MFELEWTKVYDAWLRALKDRAAVAWIDARIARVQLGSFGDHKPISDGLSELRIDAGPGADDGKSKGDQGKSQGQKSAGARAL